MSPIQAQFLKELERLIHDYAYFGAMLTYPEGLGVAQPSALIHFPDRYGADSACLLPQSTVDRSEPESLSVDHG